MNSFVIATSCQMALLYASTVHRNCAGALRHAGISPFEVHTPGLRFPASKVTRFWDRLAQDWRDAATGFTVAQHVPFGAYLVPNLLASGSKTVGEGLRRACRSYALIHSGARLVVQRFRKHVRIELVVDPAEPLSAQYAHYVLTTLVCHSRQATGVDWRPLNLRTPATNSQDLAKLKSFFGGNIITACARPGFDMARESWQHRNRTAIPGIVEILEKEARRQHASGRMNTSFSMVVGQLIRGSIGSEALSIRRIADKLAISVRTLQRRLDAEGTTFAALIDAIRHELAAAYLKDKNASGKEIASLLGYREPASFYRACRRWGLGRS